MATAQTGPVEAPSSTEPRALHLADLQSDGLTLCGSPIASVVTGGYCEHLDDDKENPGWVRTIFPLDDKGGEPCQVCLFLRAPVLATDKSNTCDLIPLFVLVGPAPRKGTDEFDVKAVCLSQRYEVLEPSVTGQYAHGPAIAIVLRLHVRPKDARPRGAIVTLPKPLRRSTP